MHGSCTMHHSRRLCHCPRRVAEAGQLAPLQVLLAKGGSTDVAAQDGATPLHAAAAHGHLEVVRALLEAGASVDWRGSMVTLGFLAGSGRADSGRAGSGRAGHLRLEVLLRLRAAAPLTA